MKTLLLFSRFNVTHLIIVDGDKRHLNGVNLLDMGLTGEASERQLELIELVYDGGGKVNTYGYQLSASTPVSLEVLEAHGVRFIVFARG